MKKFKVVQIGVGHAHAMNIFDSILKLKDVFEVVGFALPDCEFGKYDDRVKKYRDERKVPLLTVDEALEYPDLDGVIVETEELSLTKYALMAVEKNLPVHMDKPGGANLAEFQRLISSAKEKNVPLTLGYMYRFNPKINEAIEKIKKGEIGEVYCVEAHMSCESDADERQRMSMFPGGMMFFLGCHLLDVIYRIQGEPLEVIPMNTSTGFNGVTACDYGFVLLKYPHGISFAKTCSNEIGGFTRRQIVICGTGGTLEIKPTEAYEDLGMASMMREIYPDAHYKFMGTSTKSEHYNRYDNMMKNFVDVALGKKNEYSYDYELALYKLLLRSCGENI